MRYAIFCLVLACSASVHAAAFKCQTSSGQTFFSDIPCERGEVEKVRPSESESDPDAARLALERQRAYAEKQAADRAAAMKAAPGPSSLPDYSSPPPSWPAPRPVSPSSTGIPSR